MVNWLAMVTGITAAILVSGDFGRKITALGFWVFLVSSVSWIIVALSESEVPLLGQNIVLTIINMIGIYRWSRGGT